jgi:hypothetical protein
LWHLNGWVGTEKIFEMGNLPPAEPVIDRFARS